MHTHTHSTSSLRYIPERCQRRPFFQKPYYVLSCTFYRKTWQQIAMTQTSDAAQVTGHSIAHGDSYLSPSYSPTSLSQLPWNSLFLPDRNSQLLMLALDSVTGFDRQRVGLGCKTFKRRESWPIKHQHVVITLTARLREEYYKQMRAGWQTEPVRNQMFLQIKTTFIVNPDTACHQKKQLSVLSSCFYSSSLLGRMKTLDVSVFPHFSLCQKKAFICSHFSFGERCIFSWVSSVAPSIAAFVCW